MLRTEVDAMTQSLARRMWHATEPYHALVYFAPEKTAAYDDAGLKGGWMGYFASRSAAMGAVGPEVVIATFYNFAPWMVRRAIPDAWSFSSPEVVLAARYRSADESLRRLLGDLVESDDLREAATLARRAAEACDLAGRPLFAAHAALPWPEAPHLVLWHASTLLREFRGDGHVASLLTAGIDGCEAHVLITASGIVPAETLRPARGWSEDDWAAATARLHARGLLDEDGALTEAGQLTRDEVERRTDELAAPPWRALGEADCERLVELMREPLARIQGGDGVPYPNPVGLPQPPA